MKYVFVIFIILLAIEARSEECLAMTEKARSTLEEFYNTGSTVSYKISSGVICKNGLYARGGTSSGATFCITEDSEERTRVVLLANPLVNALYIYIFDEYGMITKEKSFVDQDKTCSDIYNLFKEKIMKKAS